MVVFRVLKVSPEYLSAAPSQFAPVTRTPWRVARCSNRRSEICSERRVQMVQCIFPWYLKKLLLRRPADSLGNNSFRRRKHSRRSTRTGSHVTHQCFLLRRKIRNILSLLASTTLINGYIHPKGDGTVLASISFDPSSVQ